MERKFWKVKYEAMVGSFPYAEPRESMDIYWGTWMEAARHCIKYDCGDLPKKFRNYEQRSVTEFTLPDTKGKRKGFFVC